MSIKKNAGSIAVFILLFVISFIFIIPFIWTMLTSLKPDEEIYSSVLAFLPVNPYLGHYTGIFTKLGNFFKYFSNSVVLSFWSVLFNVPVPWICSANHYPALCYIPDTDLHYAVAF